MSEPAHPQTARTFATVLEEELELIRLRRARILEKEWERRWASTEAPRGRETLETMAVPVNAALGGEREGMDPESAGRLTQARLEATGEHLTGISFSGGGIRAGTFAVGVLQGLSSLGLLRRFDYLSTVSGGGYAGGWLAAWLKRDGDVRNVELQLAPSRVTQAESWRPPLHEPPSAVGLVVDEEPEPVHHLRSYSSYMSPRIGLLMADTWTIVMIWVRNVSVNMLLFMPLAFCLALIVRLLVNWYGAMTAENIADSPVLQVFSGVAIAFGLLCYAKAFTYNGLALGEFRLPGAPRRLANEGGDIYYKLVYPLLAAALLLSLGIRPFLWWVGDLAAGFIEGGGLGSGGAGPPSLPFTPGAVWEAATNYVRSHLGLLDAPNVIVHAVLFGLMMATFAVFLNRKRTWGVKWVFISSAFVAGASGGALLAGAEQVLKSLAEAELPDLATVMGAPMLLLAIGASLIVEVALLGRAITEAEREWWSRFGALIFIAILLWVLGSATVLYVPALVVGVGLPLRLAIASGWLGTTALGVVTGKYVLPKGTGTGSALKLLTVMAPPIFLVGLLGAVSFLAAYLVNDPGVAFAAKGLEAAGMANYLKGLRGASITPILIWLGLFGLAAHLGSRFIDVNLFSLNAMYANRLIRCYLGASRPKTSGARRWSQGGGGFDPTEIAGAPTNCGPPERRENPVTGFDPDDDLDLIDLRIGYERGVENERVYWGPHLLVNTSLNLVGGSELAWRNRLGESFFLSPLYCGSHGTGYGLVDEETRENLSLGRAMSISGAAVDPNMKFYQSMSLTALLTVLNARLGYWLENPGNKAWTAKGPRYGHLLFTEFLGRTTGTGDYVHLSDGGHFENLGVYELVRRRCRYIVACDAGEDTGASDENLATLIRLCRIDFGVRIELETGALRMQGDDRLTRAHVVTGRVHYEDVDDKQLPGVLVYIKISMTGDEPPDVQQYAEAEEDFPHQATDMKQSFDEDTFESYRALGEHIARVVFEDATAKVREGFWRDSERGVGLDRATDDEARQEFAQGNRRLFSAIQGRWAEAPAKLDERYLESVKAWASLQRDLRLDPNLAGLTEDLYPELYSARRLPAAKEEATGGGEPTSSGKREAELLAVAQMVQIMESAWMELGLKARSELPLNRGWMNVLRRWTGTDAFRRFWPVFRSSFSPTFVEFCESELHLGVAKPIHKRLSDLNPEAFRRGSIELLDAEFAREWPSEVREGRGLRKMIERGEKLKVDGEAPVWVIVQAPAAPPTDGGASERFVSGVVLMAQWVEDGKVVDGAYEFFAWVRRSQRGVGLATEGVSEPLARVIAYLKQEAGEGVLSLQARYPRSGRPGENDQDRSRWMNFFSLYDFQPKKLGEGGTLTYSTVVRDVHGEGKVEPRK